MALTLLAYNALPQLNYIQGFWRMEYDTTASEVDLSSNGYNLAVSTSDSIPRTTGKIGYARDFELGDNDYLYIANASCSNLNITEALSVSFWFKSESFTNTSAWIVSKWNSDNDNRQYRLGTYDAGTGDDRIYAGLSIADGSSATTCSGDTTLSTGTWYHYCCVYNKTDIRLYLNGLLNCTPVSCTNSLHTDVENFLIGASYYNSAIDTPFDGLIDEVIIWNTALSAGEVYKIYVIQSLEQYNKKGGGIMVGSPGMI